jgi:hypothetical protein
MHGRHKTNSRRCSAQRRARRQSDMRCHRCASSGRLGIRNASTLRLFCQPWSPASAPFC